MNRVRAHTGLPKLVAVTGHRNSGKTTAIEGLLRELGARGWKVGTIKHCHKSCEVDQPGKDSWRHRKAGSARTALMTPDGLAVFAPAGDEDPRSLVPLLFPDMDLVLAEGFHWLPIDRIEVRDAADRVRPSHPDGRVLMDIPYHFGHDSIERLADMIVDTIADREDGNTESFDAAPSSPSLRTGKHQGVSGTRQVVIRHA